MLRKRFDPQEQQELFLRCITDKIILMDDHFLNDKMTLGKLTEAMIYLNQAMILVNIELELNGYKKLPYPIIKLKMGNC